VNQTVLAIFVISASITIIVQSVVLIAFYKAATKSSQQMQQTIGRLEQKADPILTTAQIILEDAQPKISEITSNLAEATAIVRAQVSQVADSTGEIVERARLQAARLDELIHSTLEKVERTTDFFQNTVIRPVRRVHAIVQAVGAGLNFFRRGRSQRQIHDAGDGEEEMFI
jgi:methyl-accepting chemotaxis protein